MKKVYAYLRLSSKGQIDGDGLERQRDSINSFCRQHRMMVINEFADEGVSGTKDGFDREGLTDLMHALKNNGVSTFIVENASRLARDLMIQEVILADCRKQKISVFDSSRVDLVVSDDDPTRKMIRQILGSVAEFEKSSLVQKLAVSRRRIRIKEGKCEGRKSYVESNHTVVPIIKEMRTDRISYQNIANHLIRQNIPTKSGGKWTRQQVTLIWHQIQRQKTA